MNNNVRFRKIPFNLIPVFSALLISILYFLFHFHYMQQFLDWDQCEYIQNIDLSLRKGRAPYFNPHHLHNEYCGMLFHQFMKKNFSFAGFKDLAFNLRLRSLLFGCMGIFFCILFLYRATGKLTWGILGSILIGFSHGYLHYATKIDTPIFPASAFIFLLWLLQKCTNENKRELLLYILTGIAFFVCIMLHQYLVFACVLFFFVLILPRGIFTKAIIYSPFKILDKNRKINHFLYKKKHYYRGPLLMALIGMLLTISAYFYIGKTILDLPFKEPGKALPIISFVKREVTFQQWLFLYSTYNRWGRGYKKFAFYKPVRGYTDAFLSPMEDNIKVNINPVFKYDIDSFHNGPAFIYNQLFVFTLIVLCGSVLFFFSLLRRYKREFLFILLSLIVYILFFVFWHPIYIEFWLIPCIIMCILSILILNYLAEKLKVILKRVPVTLFCFYICFLILIIGAHNITYHIIPYATARRLDSWYRPEQHKYFFRFYSKSVYKNPKNPYKKFYTPVDSEEDIQIKENIFKHKK